MMGYGAHNPDDCGKLPCEICDALVAAGTYYSKRLADDLWKNEVALRDKRIAELEAKTAELSAHLAVLWENLQGAAIMEPHKKRINDIFVHLDPWVRQYILANMCCGELDATKLTGDSEATHREWAHLNRENVNRK